MHCQEHIQPMPESSVHSQTEQTKEIKTWLPPCATASRYGGDEFEGQTDSNPTEAAYLLNWLKQSD